MDAAAAAAVTLLKALFTMLVLATAYAVLCPHTAFDRISGPLPAAV